MTTRLQNDNTTRGFTRTVYDDGYKYTMVYPPGWKYGDLRQPVVHKEPCAPGPSDPRIAESNYFAARGYHEHAGLTDRQPRSTAARSHQPAITGHGWPEGMQRTQDRAWSHSLRAYLAQMWMPRYVLDAQVDPSVRYEWPFFRVLARAARTRKLYLVQRIFDWDLRRAVASYILGDVRLTSALAEQGRLADLTLPDAYCCVLDEHDAQFLDACRLNGPSDVSKLVQAYPLRTSPESNEALFARPRRPRAFDLVALSSPTSDELTLLIVVVSPWDIKYDDLEEFVRVGVVSISYLRILDRLVDEDKQPDGDLDSVAKKSPLPADVLWAVIWDMCLKHNCRYFILTTYEEWVFGTLSPDMHRAKVTTHLRAPIFSRDAPVSARDIAQPCFPVPNVFEMLLLWLFAAGDEDHIYWPQPPDMPVPVKPSELSVLDGGWVGLEAGL
ncbi:hypothetical protein HD554DRAFT_2172949 [Boletus coccyginus]|nr:hypothetical protein HD554DRAFT_2172949 [Boletus coccyginus]